MIASITVFQTRPHYTVGQELRDDLKRLQNMGFKIINVFETKVNPSPRCSNQGFIILYEYENNKNT